jgi:putative endonuclease
MDKNYRKDAGDHSEDLALARLSAAGLKLLKRNHRCKGGEIDLVMLDGTTLVFVEVRFRRNRNFGGAAASVTQAKQQRLLIAARHLLQTSRELQRYRARFDLVAIDADEHRPDAVQPTLEWIKDAFRA